MQSPYLKPHVSSIITEVINMIRYEIKGVFSLTTDLANGYFKHKSLQNIIIAIQPNSVLNHKYLRLASRLHGFIENRIKIFMVQ